MQARSTQYKKGSRFSIRHRGLVFPGRVPCGRETVPSWEGGKLKLRSAVVLFSFSQVHVTQLPLTADWEIIIFLSHSPKKGLRPTEPSRQVIVSNLAMRIVFRIRLKKSLVSTAFFVMCDSP